MKNVVMMILTMVLLTGGVKAADIPESIPAFTAGEYNPEGDLISVEAKGLVCDFCAQALQKVFMKQEEVAGIHVDLSTKEILISLKNGFDMDDETITKLITDSGYNVSGIKR